MIMAAVLALSTNCTVAQAQSADSQYSQLLAKQLKKQYKNKLKELKKEKWQIYGSSRTLEVALLSHYDKLAKDGEDAHEIIGTATKFKSKNIGHQTAINNACNIYARQAGSHVKGRVVSDMGANSDSIVNEFDHFYGAYQSLVEKEIKGEMQLQPHPSIQGWKLRDAELLHRKRSRSQQGSHARLRNRSQGICGSPEVCFQGRRIHQGRLRSPVNRNKK